LLIAALAILSTVLLRDDFEDILREDLAMASTPSVVRKKRQLKSVTVPE
jgi:hypothetical protein